jgi:cytidine deaminase
MSYRDNPGNRLVEQTVALGIRAHDWEPYVYQYQSDEEKMSAALQIEGAKAIPLLLAQAEAARQYARSYRNFRVGAAALSLFYNPEGLSRFGFFMGANVKPVQGSDVINVHAEHELMIQTEQEKYPDENASIPFFVVIGDMQADQQTGIETPTLHPCGVCRNTFLENDTPINLDSICVTARPDLKEIEWYTVRSLIDYHNGLSDGSDFGYASYDSRPLALSIPMPGRSNIPIILSDYDTPEMLESDHYVLDTLQLPLLQYVQKMLIDKARS